MCPDQSSHHANPQSNSIWINLDHPFKFSCGKSKTIEITTCKKNNSTWDWKTQPLYRFYFLLKKKHSISKVKIPLTKKYPEPSLLDSASFMNMIVSYIFHHFSSTPPLTRFKLKFQFPHLWMPGHPVKIWLDAHGPGGPEVAWTWNRAKSASWKLLESETSL